MTPERLEKLKQFNAAHLAIGELIAEVERCHRRIAELEATPAAEDQLLLARIDAKIEEWKQCAASHTCGA